ncbi:probable cytochrome P450 6a14 isoform X1 [Sitophilus oryzae]|uniref:Probable cytochrome P450 6a14 isoform X1 n=1 Tax=Sitophilus oryzae TaxID=7048 RepID=A0A6J2YS37_SITOR|nr:probable cytochrome P450 6a14 isoform X1 [Sitophilus oryzae]
MLTLIFAAIVVTVTYLYVKYDKTYHYWKKRGVAQLNPIPIYGDTKKCLEGKISEPEDALNMYKKFKEMGVSHGGVYVGNRPVWMPLDPELVKTVTTKDYDYFDGHFANIPKRLFFNNLFHMTGNDWKDMRRKMTPVFTTGKMKVMLDTLLEKADSLSKLIDKVAQTSKPVEIKGIIARFTTDVIGSCGFGIECNSIEDETSEFFVKGQEIFRKTSTEISFFKKLLLILGLVQRAMPMDFSGIENFFRKVIKATVTYREENKVIRKDFIHLMIQLKNKGAITEFTNENDDIYKKTVKGDGISFEDLVGEVLLFFSAGYETSSTTMSFALLELTQHQDIQDKLREEIREVLQRHNGKMSYDALQEMIYCESVIKETLRMYPPLAILPRTCTKNYKIPNSDVVIEKGTSLKIPVWGIHNDPDYFPNPTEFNPDRFSPENKHKINPYTYIPFGDGPRQCLGLRFAMMESKVGLAVLLRNYRYTLHSSTPYPPKYVTNNFIPTVDGGIMVNVTNVN